MAIEGVRGWIGQRIDFQFPIMAICGENGSGKSTILQSAASVYGAENLRARFASDFFPDTPWETIENASITYAVREDARTIRDSVRKPTTRWRGNPERRVRPVIYVDLSRTQPVSARTGYARLAKPTWKEVSAEEFDPERCARLSEIMGRKYHSAKTALTDGDEHRMIPVVSLNGHPVSGYHQGGGELTMAEFLRVDPPKYSLLLIDEVETSLHPRSQRRLMRDLAELCRQRELQIIISTHSPYVLGELPPEGRAYILQEGMNKQVVTGVSPEFAMTKMDDEPHPECDVYVEDERASEMFREMLIRSAPETISRIQIIPYGAASVGKALGQMVAQKRFPRPSIVVLDGDQAAQPGCLVLPGEDAPERVVFGELSTRNWGSLHMRTGRNYAAVADACARAMLASDHHEWVTSAAGTLLLPGIVLWQAMCAEWAEKCMTPKAGNQIVDAIREAITLFNGPSVLPPPALQSSVAAQPKVFEPELFPP